MSSLYNIFKVLSYIMLMSNSKYLYTEHAADIICTQIREYVWILEMVFISKSVNAKWMCIYECYKCDKTISSFMHKIQEINLKINT